MSKPLTLLNREDKGDVDPGSHRFIARNPSARSPSCFTDFCVFSCFLMLQMNAAGNKRVLPWKTKFPLATAIMAIV